MRPSTTRFSFTLRRRMCGFWGDAQMPGPDLHATQTRSPVEMILITWPSEARWILIPLASVNQIFGGLAAEPAAAGAARAATTRI